IMHMSFVLRLCALFAVLVLSHGAAAAAPGVDSPVATLEGPPRSQLDAAAERAGGIQPMAAGDACLTVSDIFSYAPEGNGQNTVVTLDIGANNRVDAFGWDIGVTTYPPSRLDEVHFVVRGSRRGEWHVRGADSGAGTAAGSREPYAPI